MKEYKVKVFSEKEGEQKIETWYSKDLLTKEDGSKIRWQNEKKEFFLKKTEWMNLFYQLHREDGPAIIYANGRKEWYLYNEQVTKKETKKVKKLLNKLRKIIKEMKKIFKPYSRIRIKI